MSRSLVRAGLKLLAVGCVAASVIVFAAAEAGAAGSRHSCAPPKPHNFFKRIQASSNVSCQMVRQVIPVWNSHEFPPFIAAGFQWWEYRTYQKATHLMYTLLHTSGHRSIYLWTQPYG
jgi:hypothetical protein